MAWLQSCRTYSAKLTRGSRRTPKMSDASLSFSAITSIADGTHAKSFKSSSAYKPPAPSAFEAITKSSCFMRSESEKDRTNFLTNGGDATIASFRTLSAFQRAQEWMRGLPTSHEDEHRYYVHAGVRPGIPLDQQTVETKLWICDGFLRYTGPFPKYIVHGHSPTKYLDPPQVTPDVRDNRCNVDTGAGVNGPLSAAIFNDRQTKPIHTISAGAEN